MKPIKHRRIAYAIIWVTMFIAYVLYLFLRCEGLISLEHNYIPYCIVSLGISAFFFVKMKGRT